MVQQASEPEELFGQIFADSAHGSLPLNFPGLTPKTDISDTDSLPSGVTFTVSQTDGCVHKHVLTFGHWEASLWEECCPGLGRDREGRL